MTRIFRTFSRLRWLSPGLAGLLAVGLARADYLTDTGYTALASQLQLAGTPLPNGANVTVAQIEASERSVVSGNVTSYAYVANVTSGFSGVTLTNASEIRYPSVSSGHAGTVAGYLFGDGAMARGVTNVTAYLADDWIGAGSLNTTTAGLSLTAPNVENAEVTNSSWVGTTGNVTYDQRVLSRLDYAVQRDDFVAVVGANNGVVPQNLMASAYNVISVGLTSGGHASGNSTSVNGAVTFPHLVAPLGVTSYATPVVASAAAVLIESARASVGTATNGARSETTKAVLLAGATKSEFPGWSRNETAPLDRVYGAGELNIQNSYQILTAGEQTTDGAVAASGWDFSTISRNATATYTFDLAAPADVSIVLTWNAIYSGSNFNALTLGLANLDLSLYSVGTGGVLSLVQQSRSSGNVEHVWATGLTGGTYRFAVNYGANSAGNLSSVDYAVAWQSTGTGFAVVPEPGAWSAGFGVLLGLGILARRRRLRRAAA